MGLKAVLERLILLLASLNRSVTVAARNLAAVFLSVMTLIVLLQVVFRYLLNDSLSWSEELSKIMMVWTAFLVAPWAYRVGANVSIEMFADALPNRFRAFLNIVLSLLVLWIIVIFTIESAGFWQRGMVIYASTMPVKMAWFYSVVPFGFICLFLVGVELLIRQLMTFIDPEQDYSVPEETGVQEGE